MPIRRTLTAAAAAALTVTAVAATADAAAAAPADSSMGTYIVTLDPTSAPGQAADRAARLGGRIEHVYSAAMRGYAVRLPSAQAARLNAIPGVVDVEPDSVITLDSTQSTPDWGLDRIDQRTLPLSGSYSSGATGAGVTAYVIDTGIEFAHTDFGGRAVSGFDAIDAGSADDCNGHGTHVAGTVGGATYGVAKGVRLVGVRVLDCDGTGLTSGVIAGIDWVTANHTSPAVANMSLGGGVSTALDNAVASSIASGVTYAIAAGNGNAYGVPQDACKSSPARVSGALTVAATDNRDAPASWSNYGNCVDLFAPGVDIASAWYTSETATKTISGTSMATPHVAGVAALYLEKNPAAKPAAVSTAITAAATRNVVVKSSRYRTANNYLLFSDY